jgi:hypothetical protein
MESRGYRGKTMDGNGNTKPRAEAGDRLEHQPRVADALRSGVAVVVTTWGGRRLQGTVSDRDQAGLLLDLDGDAAGSGGYTFVPWSSAEQIDIPEVAHRRVKTL